MNRGGDRDTDTGTDTSTGTDIKTLSGILAAIRHAATHDTVSVGDILAEIGDQSFGPALLLPALILVSPLSGIPGLPTIGAAIVILIAVQSLAGRRHLWLPAVLMRRQVSSARMRKALSYIDSPAAWVDRHSTGRLALLSTPPFRTASLLIIVGIAATWPLLELLPLVTSIGAFAVSLLSIGLLTRDGIYVFAGYTFVGLTAMAIVRLAQGQP